ncbi:inorganic phosphate transporter [Edwardsiella anguillarum]|nr:inorganic phosphate transporter [Edwardsiella anguillarum]
MLGGYLYLSRKSFTDDADEQDHFRGVERVFSLLMVITACAMAFAHGSNDVANAIGPLSAIVAIVREPSVLAGTSPSSGGSCRWAVSVSSWVWR